MGTAGANSGSEVYPEWRWNTNATVGGESWSVGWTMRYYDEVNDLWRPENLTDAYEGDDILYHDLIGTYVYGNFTAYLGGQYRRRGAVADSHRVQRQHLSGHLRRDRTEVVVPRCDGPVA